MQKVTYHVWADSESRINCPRDVYEKEYDDLDEAYNKACELAHEHDFRAYNAIFHVEAFMNGVYETVETVENF